MSWHLYTVALSMVWLLLLFSSFVRRFGTIHEPAPKSRSESNDSLFPFSARNSESWVSKSLTHFSLQNKKGNCDFLTSIQWSERLDAFHWFLLNCQQLNCSSNYFNFYLSHTRLYREYITSSEMYSLHLTHPKWTHTRSSGQPCWGQSWPNG